MAGWPRLESRCPQRLWPAAAALTGCRVEAEVGSAELLGDRGSRAARGWVGEGWREGGGRGGGVYRGADKCRSDVGGR